MSGRESKKSLYKLQSIVACQKILEQKSKGKAKTRKDSNDEVTSSTSELQSKTRTKNKKNSNLEVNQSTSQHKNKRRAKNKKCSNDEVNQSASEQDHKSHDENVETLWCQHQYLFHHWPPLISSAEEADWRDWLLAPLIMASVAPNALRVQRPGLNPLTLRRLHSTWTFKSSQLPPQWDHWCNAVLRVLSHVSNAVQLAQYVHIHSSEKAFDGEGPYTVQNNGIGDKILKDMQRFNESMYRNIRMYLRQFEERPKHVYEDFISFQNVEVQRVLTTDFATPTAEIEVEAEVYDVKKFMTWKSCGEQQSKRFLMGFQNNGNTCFMNATLQCLIRLPCFVQLFLHNTVAVNKSSQPCLWQFQNMFKELIEADTAESTTYSAVSMTAYGRKQFDEDSEEDAADFLRYLLNELVEEMGASNANNVMKAMFEMRACESMKCSHDQCERLPGTDQSEVAIILVYLTDLAFDPVSGCKDVKYAMENITFGVEEMRQYPCSECGNIGTLRKQKILTQLPNVLMLHLQRFRRDTNGFRHKNTERVTFQMRMDMTSYFVDGTEREIASYDLKGVIIHIHKTINGEVSGFDSGHYVAYVKARNGRWYYMNDGWFRRAENTNEVMSAEAYVLFYTKVPKDEQPAILSTEIKDSNKSSKSSNSKRNDTQVQGVVDTERITISVTDKTNNDMWCEDQYWMDRWPPRRKRGVISNWIDWLMAPLIMASVSDTCLEVDGKCREQSYFVERKHSTWTYADSELPKLWETWRAELRKLLVEVQHHRFLDKYFVNILGNEEYGSGPYTIKHRFNVRSLLARWRQTYPVTYETFAAYIATFEVWNPTPNTKVLRKDSETPSRVSKERLHDADMDLPSIQFKKYSNVRNVGFPDGVVAPVEISSHTRNIVKSIPTTSTVEVLIERGSKVMNVKTTVSPISGTGGYRTKAWKKGNWCKGLYAMNQWPPGMPSNGKANWKDWLMAPLIMSSVSKQCLEQKYKNGRVRRTVDRYHKSWVFSESQLPKDWESWKKALRNVLADDFNSLDLLNSRLIKINNSGKIGEGPYTVVNHKTIDAYMRELRWKNPEVRQEIETYGNETQNLSELQSVTDIISGIMDGNLKSVQLHDLECLNRMMNEEYLKEIHALRMDYCQDCKQRWYAEEGTNAHAEGSYRCHVCRDDMKDLKFSRFSKSNGMDPLYHEDPSVVMRYKQLLREYPLSNIEACLISPYLSVMQVYRLKSQSQLFKGSCIAFPQKIAHIAEVLPRKPSECPIFKVRMRCGMDPSGFKDFKVRREFLRNWLLFLREHNPYFYNLIPDSPEEFNRRLNEFPIDGSVYDQIQDIELPPDNTDESSEGCEEDNGDEEGDDLVNQNGIPEFEDIMVTSVTESGSVENESEVLEGILKRAMGVNSVFSATGNSSTDDPEPSCSDSSPVAHENALGGTPVNDFSTSGFLAKCYPILFPFGVGDQTNSFGRVKTVKFTEAIKYYLKYFDPDRGVYHFATNPRFVHHIQDMDERHRSQGQASVFIKNHPKFSKMTLAELKDIVTNPRRKAELMELLKTLERYVGNVNGSAPSLFNKKRELLALMEQEGTANIWFTLTMPNWMWRDMQTVLGPPPSRTEGEDNTEYERRCSDHYRKLFSDSPHIANEHFVRRARIFLKHFFGENCLNADWHWHRYEWQSRGNIHLHGMAKIPGVDVQKLAKSVEKGRKSLQLLHLIKETCQEHAQKIGELLPTKSYDKLNITAMRGAVKKMFARRDERGSKEVEEICSGEAKTIESVASNSRTPEEHTDDFFNLLKLAVSEGCAAEAKLLRLRSFLCTSMNPNAELPKDAKANERVPPISSPIFAVHPCTTLFDEWNTGERYDFKSTFTYENYCRLVDCCQRHRHNQRYCMRHHRGTCSCRFQFPRPELLEPRIVVVEHVYEKNNIMKGRTKRTEVKLQFDTNDRWLNAHSRVGMCMWGANMDISLLIDEDTIVNYVAKYCAKSETPSTALQAVMNSKCNAGRLQGVDTASKILRQVMNYLGAGRDKTVSETCHLILSTPFVECTHKFEFINTLKGKKKLTVPTNGTGTTDDTEKVVSEKSDLLILYGQRMILTNWNSHADCLAEHRKHDLLNMSLIQFVKLYSASNGKLSVRKIDLKPVICRFSPEIKYRRKSEEYWKYCYVSLVKHKPWDGHVEAVFGGENGSVTNYVSGIQNSVKEAIMAEFQAYFRNPELSSFGGDDPLRRAIDSVVLEERIPTPGSQHSIDMEDELNGLLNGNYDHDESKCTTAEVFNHSEFFGTFREVIATVREMWTQLRLNAAIQMERPKRYLSDFDLRDTGSRQQHDVVVTFLKMIGLWKDSDGRYEKPDPFGKECGNAMLVPGPAGAGKSYVIDCLVTECEERFAEKHKGRGKDGQDIEGFVHVIAPTGKAAMGVGGYTMQSVAGLRVPCKSEGIFLEGTAKDAHQRFFNFHGKCEGKRLIAVVCDEYSMVSSIQMYWISRRLQEASQNITAPFGGVPIVFFGDPAQIPPVFGSALWRTHTDKANKYPVKGRAKEGHLLYMAIKTVMKLDVVRRQGEVYASYLKKVRDRKISLRDLQMFWNLYCSIEGMGEARYEEFVADLNTLFIYPTNAKCYEHNLKSLMELGQPILRINAEHDKKKNKFSANKEDSQCGELESCLHLAVGSKVMLRRNIATHCGLVNGSVGQVIDFIYENENDPADFKLPAVIIVNLECYTGPPFFPGEERRKWVGLLPFHYNIDPMAGTYRLQFPISLAYAITGHKSQGMTITSKAVVDIRNNQKTPGLLYVMLSRTTDINNLCIGNAVALDEWTGKKEKYDVLTYRLDEDARLKLQMRETLAHFRRQRGSTPD